MLSRGDCQVGTRSGRGQVWLKCLMLGLVGLIAASGASADTMTIGVEDPNGPVSLARVLVLDAQNSRLVANGQVDEETGLFTFSTEPDRSFVVAALTASGYVGSARFDADEEDATIEATQEVTTLPVDATEGDLVAIPYPDGSSGYASDAKAVVVSWATFEFFAKGATNGSGHYNYRAPQSLEEGVGLLCILWKNNLAIQLHLLVVSGPGEGAESIDIPSF